MTDELDVLKARVEELERLAQKWEGLPSYDTARILFARSNFIRVKTARDAARADLEEAVALLLRYSTWTMDEESTVDEDTLAFLAKRQPSVEGAE